MDGVGAHAAAAAAAAAAVPAPRPPIFICLLAMHVQKSSRKLMVNFIPLHFPDPRGEDRHQLFNEDSIPIQTFVRASGANISITCPEIKDETATYLVR